jgi:demethylmenaquinone methyltransferase/2-methoxy-6-polyprenyl-1,4-benzoquinol methylase
MHDYYAARASEYDKIYQKPERQSDLREIETWLSHAFERRNVLEVACGTGYWTQFIAQGASCMLAVDAAAETIEVAKARVPREKVTFHIGDAYELPKTEPVPDAGFAGFWYSHVPRSRTREFLVGFNASIQPGSKVILIDNQFVAGSSTPISETDAEGNTYQTRQLVDASSHKVLKNSPSEADLREVLKGIGTHVTYRAWQFFWAVEYFALEAHASHLEHR